MNQTATVDTSINAYNDIKPKAPAIREQVLNYVKASIAGVSRTQIAEALNLNEITVGSRLTELLQSGNVKRKGETTLSTSGKPEHLYVESDGVPLPKPVKTGATMSKARFVELLRMFGVDSDAVRSSFIWMDQPEGNDFWDDVANKLEA